MVALVSRRERSPGEGLDEVDVLVIGYGAAAALAAHHGELEELEDPPTGPLSSYYIPNLTFPHLPTAQGLRLVLRRLKQTERCPQPTGGARM